MERLERLEELFTRYADLPREVIVKEELLTEGFSRHKNVSAQQAPELLRLEGGPFSLRRTIVRVVDQTNSPYMIQSNGGNSHIVDRDRGTLIALAHPFPQDPRYLSKTFLDGTPYSAVVSLDGEVMVVERCQLWGPEVECKFCSLNEIARKTGSSQRPKEPEKVAEVIADIFVKKARSPQEMPLCIHINGGSVLDGLQEEDFYLGYVDAIRERIGNQVPILLEMFPKPLDVEKRIHRHGVEARLSNLEIWDRRLFALLCPGKERKICWEEWVRRLIDQVYVYGWNAVLPGLVVGLEMVKPWGSKSMKEAIASTSEGMRFLMQHGVVPRLVHWRVDPYSALAGQTQPPTEFFLELDRIWYDAWVNYGQDEPIGYLMGPGRSRYPDSGVFDVGRGEPLEIKARSENKQ